MMSNRWSCRLPKVLALVLLMMLSAWYLNQVVVDNICVKNLPVEILSVETLVHVRELIATARVITHRVSTRK